jgi:hypothetical protein
MPILRRYGAKPSPFKSTDYKYARVAAPHQRPSNASVRKPGEPMLNQLYEGSCVINTIVAAIEHLIPGFLGSRSFGYYKTRVKQHDVHSDDGCDPRIALDAIRHSGLPPETRWPYDGLEPDKSKYFAKPPPTRINREARKLVLDEYQALGQTAGMLNDICDCIAFTKLPVMIGVAVYESFESDAAARTGKIPLPRPGEQLIGYHEILAEDYRDDTKEIRARNWWDTDFGDGGYIYFPYDYASNPKLLTDSNVVMRAHLQ